MEIALYVRASTNRQQHAQTIEQQLDRLRPYVAAHPDWHLAEEHVYRDDGYSGAKLNRPGLDRLRDRAAMAAFERVLMTAPDRLARNYVHQVLLLDELAQRGCQVEFLDRPMSQDPHDQLLLQIRGAVAEYERTLIADRIRRGRQAKLRSGQLLPWAVAPYGYVLDPERPRDPQRLRLDPVKAAVIVQIFAWYTDPPTPATLYSVAKRLTEAQIPTRRGNPRWHVASVRGILCSPVYMGTAYSGRTRPAPARKRRSALLPVGAGTTRRPAPAEDWIAIPVPAIVSEETFAAAQARLARNTQMARRNNTAHDYLLRGLVSCGQCQLSCLGCTRPPWVPVLYLPWPHRRLAGGPGSAVHSALYPGPGPGRTGLAGSLSHPDAAGSHYPRTGARSARGMAAPSTAGAAKDPPRGPRGARTTTSPAAGGLPGGDHRTGGI